MRRAALVVVCLAASALPARAWADGDAEAAALAKFEAGRALFDAQKYDEALAAFGDSYRLQASPNSRLYMGRCYEKLGKVASAYVSFRLAAREAHDRLLATGEKRYGLTRDAATAEEADLEPRVPRLTLAVPAGLPDDFVLTENGRPIDRAAWGTAVETDPGHVVLDARGHRLRPFHLELDLAEGQQQRVEVPAVRVPTAYLVLRFDARPAGLAIAVDGAPLDPRDWGGARELDVGAHALVARAPGYLPMTWRRALADGERAEARVHLEPVPQPATVARGTPKWLFFGAAGVAAASLGVATVFALKANALSTDERAKDPLLRDPAEQDTIRTESNVANGFFIGAAVLGAGAAVLAFTTLWREPSPARTGVAWAPWADARGGGLSARGTLW